MSAPSLAVLHNLATQLRIDSVTLDVGSRLRPSDDVSVGGGDRRGAVLRRDAVRSAATRSIPKRIASCCRRATRAPILYAAWAAAGAFPRDGSAEAAQAHVRSRRPSDAAPAVRRRRDRIARAGTRRRRRASRSTRAASTPTTARTCCSATARRAEGSVWEAARGRRASQARQSVRDHRRQRPRPEPRDAVGPRHRRRSRRAGARSAGTPIAIDGHDIAADPRRARRGPHAPRAGRR